jgi:hypothetical protein
MKNTMKAFACGTVATLAVIGLFQPVQAQQAITGWGADTGAVSGITITEPGSPAGYFIATGPATANADMRADLPTPVSALGVGQVLTVSGQLVWTNGYMAGAGGLRIGLVDYASLGTLSGKVWSVGDVATGYWWGLPTGGNGVSNPGGGEITAKPASAGNAWFSGTGGYAVPGTLNDNPANMVASTYYFSFSVQNNGGTATISYSVTNVGTSNYWEVGSVVDTNATVPLSFNAFGFFCNSGSTAFNQANNPSGVSFSNITETIGSSPYLTVLGAFEGVTDPTDAGWTNLNTGNKITSDSEDSFLAAGVTSCPQSLEIAGLPGAGGAGTVNQPNLILGLSPAQIGAFFNNSWLTFTWSVPSAASSGSTAGYSEIYGVQVQAPGLGTFTLPWGGTNSEALGYTTDNVSGMPLIGYYSSMPLETERVTINYSSVFSQITGEPSPSYLQLIFQGDTGNGAPDYMYMNNVELSTAPFGSRTAPPPPPPPTMGIQVAKPGLRIFAGANTTGPREELATSAGYDVNWVGPRSAFSSDPVNYPVKYSFTIVRGGAETNYFQTHIFLIPTNEIPTNTAQLGSPYNNNYVDYQTSNMVWLQILGTNGSQQVIASVAWKTNYPNSNPTNVELTITNPTIVGTWSLVFSNATQGALVAPGSTNAFTIHDANASADFAGPVTAYFGVEANSAPAEGDYLDYSQISITGAEGNVLTENFLTDSTFNPNGYWTINPTAADSSIILVTAGDPLWVTWSPADIGYGLAVSPGLPINEPPGYNYLLYGYNGKNSFVLPQQFNNYSDVPVANLQGTTMWELIPSDCLPSYQGVLDMGVTNAYFELINPPPAN